MNVVTSWKHITRVEFKEAGLDLNFVQDNQSKSTKGVIRGLHFQYNNPQGKLVRVIKGEVFDVAVDLRKEFTNLWKMGRSNTFRRKQKTVLCS